MITYVGGKAGSRAGSTSTSSQSLTTGLSGGSGGSPIEGDLVVVTVSVGTQARQPALVPSGYTGLTANRTTATTYDTNVQTSYKFMGSTPDTTVTIPSTGDIADGQAWTIQVFRGVDPTTPLDVTPQYATGSGVNSRPQPPSITPVTPGAWVVVAGGGAAATGTTLYTSADLTNFIRANGADTNDGAAGAGYIDNWTSGAVSPATFGGGSVNAANSWGCTTLVLHRAAPFPFTDDFNRASLGNDWTIGAGAGSIVSSQFKCSDAAGVAAFALHPDAADVRIGMTAGDGNNRAIYARVLGSDYLWAFASGGNIGVYEFVAGAPTLLGFVAGSLSASDRLELQAVGTAVKVYKNGVALVSVTTSVTAAGKSGLWTDTINTVFDDFSAELNYVEANGSLAAGAAVVGGAATSGSEAGGALAAQAASIDGASSVAWGEISAAGALQAAAAVVDGTATSGSQAGGALTTQAAQIAGAASSSSSAAGDLVAQAAAMSGAATVADPPIAASGALQATAASLDGAATSGSVATGALAASAAAVAGQAVVSDAPAIVAVGDLVAGAAVIAGTATVSGAVAATEEADDGGAGGRAGTVWISYPPPLTPALAVLSARGGLVAGPAQIRGVAVLGKTAKQKRNERTLRMLLLAA